MEDRLAKWVAYIWQETVIGEVTLVRLTQSSMWDTFVSTRSAPQPGRVRLLTEGEKTRRGNGLLTDVALKFSATQRKWCLFSLTNLISTNTGNFISSVFTSLIKSV